MLSKVDSKYNFKGTSQKVCRWIRTMVAKCPKWNPHEQQQMLKGQKIKKNTVIN